MTREFRVYGIVQGIGFRPFVHRLAEEHGLSGRVANVGPYVKIVARGTEAALSAFREELVLRAPERAAILRVEVRPSAEKLPEGFFIVESGRERGHIFVSPDIAICARCQKELFDKNDRRYLHPFINCTACGPRLTILDAMPYDRERTSMGVFPMCAACAAEYRDRASRRYDAQPVCCNDCGPEVYILGSEERGAAAITRARRMLATGGIVAVKGIGGFHLCCDATDEAAVMRLREKKRRPSKPFAVMARDMAAAVREAELLPSVRALLDGPEKPIVLLKKRAGGKIAGAVAPHNPKIGLMLPYAPLQLLIFSYPDGLDVPDTLVMTSGNPSGAPICRTDDEAREVLLPLADAVLSHNRRIRVRADDSVMDLYEGAPYMIRRSRGYAPLPVTVSGARSSHAVLAVGGELKNTFCLARDGLFYPSAHIGDMGDLRSVEALRETAARMASLLEMRPEAVAADPHPRYRTSRLAAELGLPVISVQHHHAHIVSCMAENGFTEPVIGVAFDGTGFGTDGGVWGGEFLRADCAGFSRLGSVRPFPQAGGDRAAREGWRIAAGLLFGEDDDTGAADAREARALSLALRLGLGTEKELRAQFFLLRSKLNTAVSTSAGRLFDAASAVLGLCRVSSFEGEAAMRLQFAAEAALSEREETSPPDKKSPTGNEGKATDAAKEERDEAALTLRRASDGRFLLPTTALLGELVRRRLAGEDAPPLALLFHERLASMVAAGCRAAREQTGLSVAALSGGVFQNTLLLRLAEAALRRDGFRVLRHRLVPPNDGGLALGQAVIAATILEGRRRSAKDVFGSAWKQY